MRRTTLAAGGVALVLTLSACGGGTGGTSAAPAPGAGDSGKTSLFSDPLQLAAAAKAGTEKSKSSKFSMEMGLAGQSIKATGEGRYDGDNTAMSMKMDMAGQNIEMIFVDKVLYMKLPASQGAALGSGKPWVKISADGTDPMSKQLGPMLNQTTSQNDPTKMLDKISKAGTITKSEQVQLDGQPASHYVLDLDFAKLLDQIGEQIPGGLPAASLDSLKGKDLHIPAELWLNSDQLPVQVTMDMTKFMQAAGVPGGGEAKTTLKYSDWGSPVDIEAPPADQVGDFSGSIPPTR